MQDRISAAFHTSLWVCADIILKKEVWSLQKKTMDAIRRLSRSATVTVSRFRDFVM